MIRVEHDGAVARLTLDRSEARNALAVRHWQALGAAIAEIGTSDARVLVVSGSGGAFCAGADLGELETFHGDQAAAATFRSAMHDALDALADLPIATLAWIDGPCFGAGVALAMACDMRVAAPDATFGITPAKIGIGYPQEDVARLVALVGPGWASRLLFTGAVIDASEALSIGLVEAVGDAAQRDAWVGDLLAGDPHSIAILKGGISLATRGIASDKGQDRAFEQSIASDRLRDHLSRRRAARGLRTGKA